LEIVSNVTNGIGVDSRIVLLKKTQGGMQTGNLEVLGAMQYQWEKIYQSNLMSYMTSPDSSDWDVFGNSVDDWSIDFWAKHNVLTGQQQYISQRASSSLYWSLFHVSGSGIRLYAQNSAIVIDSGYGGEITDTDWHHITLCKIGNVYAIYKDGVQVTYATTNNIVNVNAPVYIGQSGGNNEYLNGAMDEIRIERGNPFSANPDSGLTDTIDVPVIAHAPNSDTKLLLHGDDFNDASGRPRHEVTNNNVTLDTGVSKWGDASAYFNGTNSSLSVPYSKDWDLVADIVTDWTAEFWVKFFDHDGEEYLLAQSEDATNRWEVYHVHGSGIRIRVATNGVQRFVVTGTEITDTNWHHIALIKVGNVWSVYQDGVQTIHTTTNEIDVFNAPLTFGTYRPTGVSPFQGWADDIRISKANVYNASPNSGLTDTITVPTGAHSADSDTKLLLHLDETWFTDLSSTGHVITNNNGVTSALTSPFGDDGSSLFNGTTQYLSAPDSNDWQLGGGTGDFTIECFIKFNALQTLPIVSQFQNSTNHVSWIWASAFHDFAVWSGGSSILTFELSSAPTVSVGKWYHVALVRKDTTDWKIFIDGVSQSLSLVTGSWSASMPNLSAVLEIGRYSASPYYLNGGMREFRISNSARYTSNFTVPSAKFTNDANTKLLLSMQPPIDSATGHELTSYFVTSDAFGGYFDKGFTFGGVGTTELVLNGLDGDNDGFYFVSAVTTTSTGNNAMRIRLNGDSASNYGFQRVSATGTTVSASRSTSTGLLNCVNVTSAGNYSYATCLIYPRTGDDRIAISTNMTEVNGTSINEVNLLGLSWNNTASNITSMTFYGGGGTLSQGTSISVYRLKL
jgi:hypothetical protein